MSSVYDFEALSISGKPVALKQYKGKPLLIGGSGDRGVVGSCSYEARRFGVHSAMPMKMAKQLCPEAIILRGDSGAYLRKSDEVTEIIRALREHATAAQWRGRGDMMAKSDAYAIAYDDYTNALKLDPHDEAALTAFTRTAVLTNRATDAMGWIKAVAGDAPHLHVDQHLRRAGGVVGEIDDRKAADRKLSLEAIAFKFIACWKRLVVLRKHGGDVGTGYILAQFSLFVRPL